jgi:tetratricopeptide (TPR) repeat protein
VNLGYVLKEQQQYAAAEGHLQQAVAIDPALADAHYLLGVLAQEQEQLDQAIAHWTMAVEIKPDFAAAYNNMGNVFQAQGRLEAAVESYKKSLSHQPDQVDTLYNCGNVLENLTRLAEAITCYDRVTQISPQFAEAFWHRGNALIKLERNAEALDSYNQALLFRPDYADAHCNHGNALLGLSRLQEALDGYERAIQLKPDFVVALNNHGNVLCDLSRPTEALASYERLIQCQPDYAVAFSNYGNALRDLNRLDDALAAFERALQLQPDFASAHSNESICRLLMGDFALGWKKYEARLQLGDFEKKNRSFLQLRWNGKEPLEGKTILLHAEQGLGDTIQFCRYAKLVAARGATVLLEVPPTLKSLLANTNGMSRIYGSDEALPAFDYHCPLLSLPLAFSTTLDSIPADVPYIAAKPELVEQLAHEIAYCKGIKIGLCWKGSPKYSADKQRSLGIAPFDQLFSLQGTNFFTLMPNSRDEFIQAVGTGIDLGRELDGATAPFEETAALIANLDLVITCDTSIGHLAGAMGKPVWILLPFRPDWRWLLDRSDSPWYPSVRLFRQPRIGDWESVMAMVAEELKRWSMAPGKGL